MLVLNRREGEKIIIDGNIVITVLFVEGSRVKIGIEAPKNVSVDRHEIFEKKAKRSICDKKPYANFLPHKIA